VKNFKSKSTNTGNFTDYAGEYENYRFKSNTYVDWSKDSYFATFGTRYVGSVKSQCWDETTYCTDPDAAATWPGGGVNKIKAQIYNDLTLGYKTSSKGQFLFGVNNLFNVKPKIILDSASNFGGSNSSSAIDPSTPVDRYMFVRFTQAF
jgi:iron complex outermembrane receptor protein